MKESNIFRVIGNSNNAEYFDCRESAINFIIDEFSIASLFRTEQESEKLSSYLMEHNETPNQYPCKYKIEKININHEYDTKLVTTTLDAIDKANISIKQMRNCLCQAIEHILLDKESHRISYLITEEWGEDYNIDRYYLQPYGNCGKIGVFNQCDHLILDDIKGLSTDRLMQIFEENRYFSDIRIKK